MQVALYESKSLLDTHNEEQGFLFPDMSNLGWIKIHRKIVDNPIYKNSELFHLFVHCLVRANHKPTRLLFNKQEIILKTGQFVTGRYELAKEVRQSPKSVYNRLQILRNLGILDIKTNNKFSLITVIKYSTYQDGKNESGQQNGQPEDNKRTTNGQQMDTDKNNKNIKNDKNDKKRTLPEKSPAEKFNLQNELREVFENYYYSKTNLKYYFNGKDAGNLKQIIQKIRNVANRELTDAEVLTTFHHLLLKLNNEWILKNLCVSVINSKFNEILNQIKNGSISSGTPGKRFDADKANQWLI